MVSRHGLKLRVTADGWEVVGVAAEGPARRAGLRRGDVIVAVHRVPVAKSVLGPTLLQEWDGYGRIDVRLPSGEVRALWVDLRGRGRGRRDVKRSVATAALA
jgi:C-terminal processing protease CtpA/Prc